MYNVCCVLYNVIPKNCAFLEWVYSVLLAEELYSILYNFINVGRCGISKSRQNKINVYRILIGTKVHVSRSDLCVQKFVHLFPEFKNLE